MLGAGGTGDSAAAADDDGALPAIQSLSTSDAAATFLAIATGPPFWSNRGPFTAKWLEPGRGKRGGGGDLGGAGGGEADAAMVVVRGGALKK